MNIYAWLAENEPEQSSDEQHVAPGQSFEASPALGDELWKALAPQAQPTETAFGGTGEQVTTRWVATDQTSATIEPELLSAALEGAINGSRRGQEDLQAYFDVVAGNERELLYRAETLLAALGESSIANSYTSMSMAVANISEAARTALWTGYITNAFEAKDFVLMLGSRGYDLGPARHPDGSDNPPEQGFIRVPAESQMLRGSTEDVITSPVVLFGDDVRSIQSLTDEVAEGEYVVYVLTSTEAGSSLNDTFGTVTRTGTDEPIRRVNLLEQFGESAKVYMSSFGVSAELEDPLFTAASDDKPVEGYAMAMRVVTTNNQLHIEFEGGEAPPYIVGIILEPASPILEVRLAEIMTTMLDLIRPFAGGDGGEPTDFSSQQPQATTTSSTSDGGFTAGSSGSSGSGGAGGSILLADAGGPHTVTFGDNITRDGTQSSLDGELVLAAVENPEDLVVEWLFDIDGDGELDLVATDLVATIDSDLFDGPGIYEGILRITLGDLVAVDDVVIEIVAAGGGDGEGGDGGGGGPGGGGGTVPEPATAALMATGLGALAMMRRRKRRTETESDDQTV